MRTKTARHLAVFTMLLALACRFDDEAATLPPFPEPGSLAPALALPVFLAPDGDHTVGDIVDLSDQRGHIVVPSSGSPPTGEPRSRCSRIRESGPVAATWSAGFRTWYSSGPTAAPWPTVSAVEASSATSAPRLSDPPPTAPRPARHRATRNAA